jgi:O-antigen/teichoic acid export membrane protein
VTLSEIAASRSRLARSGLPEGTFAVGAGLVISGLSTYAFLSVAKHALGSSAFSPLGVMWSLTFFAAPGFFLPIEQEVGRALAHRKAQGNGGAAVVRRAAVLGGALAGFLIVLGLAISPLITRHLFDRSWLLLVGFIIAIGAYFCGHLSRGAFSGSGEFRAYGEFLAADGGLRLVACIALAIVGVKGAGPYGLLVGLSPIFALAFALRRRPPIMKPGPEAPWAELTANLGWLLLASVSASALVMVGPVLVSLLATKAEHDLASHFLASRMITTVPLFLFQAVQAALLPRLAALAASGRFGEFRDGFRRLLKVVMVIALAAVAGSVALGPFVVRTLFGSDADIGRMNLTLLAIASALYMVALAISQALIALHGHAVVGLGWLAGVVMLFIVTAFGHDLLMRVEAGLVAGSLTSLAIFVLDLRQRLARGESPDADSLYEALTEAPLEL